MSKRILLLVVAFVGIGAGDARSQSTILTLQLFPLTGEVRIANDSQEDFTFVLYSLSSASGALNGTGGVWKTIADNYDASGNGFIDATNEWTNLTPSVGTNATNLSEGVFSGQGGVLPANRTLSLGKIWDFSRTTAPDVIPRIDLPNGSSAVVNVVQTADGDYFRDGNVDEFDYLFWKIYFGSTSANFADGNLDGIVNTADYTIWRNNYGSSVPGSGSSGGSGVAGQSLSATAVPEPTSLLLGLLAGAGLLAFRAGRRSPAVS